MIEIDCEAALPLAHRVHDGEASAEEAARLSAHQEGCLACREASLELRELSGLLRAALPRPAAPTLAGPRRTLRTRAVPPTPRPAPVHIALKIDGAHCPVCASGFAEGPASRIAARVVTCSTCATASRPSGPQCQPRRKRQSRR